MDGSERRWGGRYWDPEAFEVVCRAAGTSPEEVERRCRLRSGRFDELAERGWCPHIWEALRVAEVLGMSMDDLCDEALPESV